jgi:proline iminopeptidase
VEGHDVESQLDRITAPTLISFGRHDTLTSTRFAAPMVEKLRSSELLIFEDCAHAPLYENVQEFNEKTLQFLLRQAAVGTA